MAWFNSKVKVTFIDESTGEVFGVTEMPPNALPESFEIDTTLHLDGDDWSVVSANPKVRAEYAKSLTLRLHRIEMMEPKEILFSLPSICDSIPGVSNQPLIGNELVLAEDDWRQIELVSNGFRSDVDAEIAKIQLIHENAFDGGGWGEIHLRTKPEVPLNDNLRLDDLAKMFPESNPIVGVAYCDANTQITDGYAFRVGELTIYGIAPNGLVTVVAFDQYAVLSHGNFLDQVRAFARDSKLDLVDWCHCARLPPEDSRFESVFEKAGT